MGRASGVEEEHVIDLLAERSVGMPVYQYLRLVELLLELTEVTAVPSPAVNQAHFVSAYIQVSLARQKSLKLAVIAVAVHGIGGTEGLQNLEHRCVHYVPCMKDRIYIVKYREDINIELRAVLPVCVRDYAYLHVYMAVPDIVIVLCHYYTLFSAFCRAKLHNLLWDLFKGRMFSPNTMVLTG